MMVTDWINLIQDVGFPIFVVVWFMFRTEKIIQANTEAIIALSAVVRELCEQVNRGDILHE